MTLFIDAIVVKIRDGQVSNRPVYTAIGVTVDGKRDILGLDFYDEVDGALYHLREWVDCVRSRKQTSCPAEEGVRSAAAAHLANLSYRQGKLAKWAS